MNQRPLPGIPEAISQSADRMMERIQSGKIRKHLLGSTSHVRYSTIEDIELKFLLSNFRKNPKLIF